jgi:antitoxin VapB
MSKMKELEERAGGYRLPAAQCRAKTDRGQAQRWWLSLMTISVGATMDTARLFQSGRSQAVRLPKKYRFAGTEVVVQHFGNGVLLLPADDPWQTLQAGLAAFEPGFELTRQQPEEQVRVDVRPDLGS